MAKIGKNLINERLNRLNLDDLAETHGFTKRKGSKISLVVFIQGFMSSFMKGLFALEDWAASIGLQTGISVTAQALQDKFYDRHINTVKATLERALTQQIQRSLRSEVQHLRRWAIFEPFKRVLLEDSTCQAVDASLHEHFKSASNGGDVPSATMRVQTIFDLVSNAFVQFTVQSYRDNDQKAASNILDVLAEGDLVIRDMGYWLLKALRSIMDKNAYFLSLCKPNTYIMDSVTGQQLNLLAHLRKRPHHNSVELEVLIGKEEQLPVRLVCLRLPDTVAAEKRRKARANATQKSNHSADYYELLGWDIFVTNVPTMLWSPKQISYAYRVRWRIETTYKCWKSVLNFKDFFVNHKMMAARARLSAYLILLLYAIVFDTVMTYFAHAVTEHHKTLKPDATALETPALSMLKAAKIIRAYFDELLTADDWTPFSIIFYKHATYQTRTDRTHFEHFTY
jgi:hypothetical protein